MSYKDKDFFEPQILIKNINFIGDIYKLKFLN